MDPFTIFVTVVSIISGVASYQQAKKIQRDIDRESRGVEANIESNIKAIPVVYGERRVGGVRVYIDTSKDIGNKYLYMVMAMAEGEVEDIHSIEIDDIPITDEKFILSGLGANFTYEIFYGSDTQSASDLIIDGVAYSNSADVPPEVAIYLAGQEGDKPWNQNHKLNGVAYLAMRFLWDSNAYNGVPNVTAIVKGKKVYDPRNPTAPKAWSTNPALCIRDYLTSTRYGKGIPESAINDTMIAQAANDYDSFVVTPYDGGDDITLFEMNTVLDTEVEIIKNLNDMLMSCRGFLPYVDGKYGMRVDQATNHVMEVNSDYIIGGISIAGTKKEDRFNQVKVNFFNKDKEYKEDTAVFPDVDDPSDVNNLYQTYLAEDGGEPLVDDIKIDGISNYYTAREMAKLFLLRSRLGTAIGFRGTSELMELEVGDTFLITQPTPAWTNKKFQVQEIGLNFDGTVNIQAIEYSDAIYTYNTASEETPFVPTKLPNPNKLAPVTDASASAGSFIDTDGRTVPFIDISWTAPNDALVDRYEIKYTIDDEAVIYSAVAIDTTHRIVEAKGSYDIEIYAVNGFGSKSTGVTLSDIVAVADTVAPSSPSLISLTAGFKQIELSWSNPTDNDFDLIEIKSNIENNEATASLIASIRSDYYLHRLDANETRFYWLRALDRTGNASDWVYGGTGTTERLLANDFTDGVITIDFLDTSTTNIINSVADYDTDISNINTNIANLDVDIIDLNANVETRALDSDFQNITQNLDNNLTTASERLLSMSLFASEQAQIMRDAGVTVDPDNGSVTIQAVEQLRTETDTQFTQVGIEIDAQTAEIELRATRTFVENEIAAAQLDPTDFTAFTDLQARVNQAEIDIDANTASVTLKADQTELDSLDVRINQAEIDIDANSASIALKASQSEFDDLSTRISTAEIQLDAIDAPSITQTVIDVNNLSHRVNEAEAQDLKQLLEIYDTRQVLQQDIAFARTQITADTLETRESIATQRTELVALIDQNEASIIAETQARSNADSAITSDVLQLQADLNIAETGISGNSTAITSLDSRVTTNEGDITSQAGQITALDSGLTTANTNITGNATAITSLDTRVTSAEGTITTQSTDITNLETDVTNLETDTSANATAISGLDTRVTSTENTITSQATSITEIESDISGLETSVSGNATAISGLDTRVTSAEGSISTQSTSITNLETAVNTKASTYRQDEAPTGDLIDGDLWIDTDDSNKLYRHNGTDWIESDDTRIGDTATALSQLTTTVTQNGTDITAISQDVTQLQTDVSGNTAEITSVAEAASSETRASAKRLETLVSGQAVTQLTEILNREDNQDFLSGELSIVRTDFNAVTIANSEAIAQARTDLTALINGNSADITSEQLARVSADQALTSDINSLRADLTTAEGNITGNAGATTLLTARVDVTESDITSISADVTTLQSGLSNAETDITANSTAVSALDTRVTSNEFSITSQATDITELETSLTTAQTNISANATAVSALDTRVTSAENTITSQSSSITSLSSDLSTAQTDIGNLETDVSGLDTSLTNTADALSTLTTTVTSQGSSISSNATAITNLQTTTGSNTASISTLQSTTDGIEAQYSVTINNNGTVSGFGLVSDIIDGEPTSAFSVSADQFFLSGETLGDLWDVETRYFEGDTVQFNGRTYEANNETIGEAPDNFISDWTDITYIPFVVYTTDTTVSKGGEDVVIPKGVYIKDGFIQNASITDANIQSLNADKITAGTISTSRLNIDGVTLDTDANGNLIIADGGVSTTQISNGSVTNDKVGDISADKITAGTISTSRLNIDGVTLDTNESGQLIISNNGVDTTQIKDNAVTSTLDAYTATGISNLANGTKEVQTLTIQATGSSVQIIATARISVNSGNFSSGAVIIKRNGSTIRAQTYSAFTNNSANEVIITKDEPSAGEVIYTVEVYSDGSSSTLISARYLQAMETKK